jgi:hypothetical protein
MQGLLQRRAAGRLELINGDVKQASSGQPALNIVLRVCSAIGASKIGPAAAISVKA